MKNHIRTPLFVATFLLFLCLLFCSSALVPVISQALGHVVSSLFPSLFLFLWFGAFLSELCQGERAPRVFRRILPRVFRLPAEAWSAWFIGLFCGFPSGALAVEHSFHCGQLSEKDAARMLLFVNNPSPAFCISYLGAQILDSPFLGLGVYASCVLSSLLLAFLVGRGKHVDEERKEFSPRNVSKPVSLAFTDSMRRSIAAFAALGALYVATEALWVLPEQLLWRLGISERVTTVLYGLLDAAGACARLSSFSRPQAALLASVFLTFYGANVWLQILPALRECGVKSRQFWFYRLSAVAFSCIFMNIFVSFPAFLSVFIL